MNSNLPYLKHYQYSQKPPTLTELFQKYDMVSVLSTLTLTYTYTQSRFEADISEPDMIIICLGELDSLVNNGGYMSYLDQAFYIQYLEKSVREINYPELTKNVEKILKSIPKDIWEKRKKDELSEFLGDLMTRDNPEYEETMEECDNEFFDMEYGKYYENQKEFIFKNIVNFEESWLMMNQLLSKHYPDLKAV